MNHPAALFVLVLLASRSLAAAELVSRAVEYKDGDAVLEGFLAYDTAGAKNKPGVLVVHEWTGLGPYVMKRAEQLARMGYVAFAADIYGKGVRPSDPKEAGKTAGLYKGDRALMRSRVNAGFSELKRQTGVDPARTAAIGYCFGGTAVLELARSGAEVQGIVSFHGGLSSPVPEDAKKIKAKVLALHGAEDPYVPAKEVEAFEGEMRQGGVDWQLVKYSGAVHAFTNPQAGDDPAKGAAYHASADRRSWQAMSAFFEELFK